MENSHDIILIIIIGAIIILQIYVFWRNYNKIQNYKKTIQKVRDFEIIEVSVPEEWIKDIEVNKILNDPIAFKKRVSSYSSQVLARESENAAITTKKFSGESNIPEKEGQFEKKPIESFPNHQFVGRDKEYDGPLKSLRNKIKNILE